MQSNIETDFHSFLKSSFSELNPGEEFLGNWHIEALSAALKEVELGKVKRLIITLPPRYLKSICVSAAWPAWLLAKKPSARIICTSYSQHLSHKHSLDCKNIMLSKWYKKLFPKVIFSKSQNDKRKFLTSENGFRLATSVGGSITGEGGDILIVDDPHNPLYVSSVKARKKVIDWFEQSFATRLNNKKKGAIIIAMQRLHQNDLIGYLLKKAPNNWIHLNLPAISAEDSEVKIGKFLYKRKKGDLLHPEREGIEELAVARLELGEIAFNSQYQQNPLASEGQILKSEWLQYYKHYPENGQIIQSWDTAIKTGTENDYSVCTIWMITEKEYYLLDVFRAKLEFPELKKKAIYLAENWKLDAILIEDKASGQSLIQELAKHRLPIVKIKPINNKIVRFAAVTTYFSTGKVFFPEGKLWLSDLVNELLGFPHTGHDDQVDSCSQFLSWSNKINCVSTKLRKF